MALTSGFTDVYKVVITVAYYTDGCAASDGNHSHLAGGKTQGCVLAFLSHELSGVAGGANELSALAGEQLDAVDHRADGDVLELQ